MNKPHYVYVTAFQHPFSRRKKQGCYYLGEKHGRVLKSCYLYHKIEQGKGVKML